MNMNHKFDNMDHSACLNNPKIYSGSPKYLPKIFNKKTYNYKGLKKIKEINESTPNLNDLILTNLDENIDSNESIKLRSKSPKSDSTLPQKEKMLSIQKSNSVLILPNSLEKINMSD